MARLMVGEEVQTCQAAESGVIGEAVLVVKDLSRKADDIFGTDLKDVSLTVHAGEILGLAGVSGSGQQELLGLLSGEARSRDPASIQLLGVDVGHLDAAERRRLGLGFVPEERLGRGAVPGMTLLENSLLTAARQGMVARGLIDEAVAADFTRRCITEFGVKCTGPQALADSLSGGNLQKFIVGREMLQSPKVLVVAQPTWGVDVQASAFIRRALVALRDCGVGILVVSDDLDELFELSDRIAVIAAGRLSPAKRRRDTDTEEIGLWMSGLWPGSAGAAGRSDREVRHVA